MVLYEDKINEFFISQARRKWIEENKLLTTKQEYRSSHELIETWEASFESSISKEERENGMLEMKEDKAVKNMKDITCLFVVYNSKQVIFNILILFFLFAVTKIK